MRDIAHGFFEHSPAMAGPVLALVLFFVVFAVALVRVLRTRAADWTHDAALALEGDAAPQTREITKSEGENS